MRRTSPRSSGSPFNRSRVGALVLEAITRTTVFCAGAALIAGCSSGGRPTTDADAGGAEAPAESDFPYLWYAGAGLNAFTERQTAQSSDTGARYYVAPRQSSVNFHDLAFDDQGNLWTIPFSGDQIIRLPASALPPSPTAPSPDLVITSAALQGAQNLAFDGAGNLWVVSYNGAGVSVATIARFDNLRGLLGEVTLSASAVIGPGDDPAAQDRFRQPSAIAFDGAGSLWLAATANLLRFDNPQALSGVSAPRPAAIISNGAAYASVATDAAGALWITGASSGYFIQRLNSPGAISGQANPAADAMLLLPATGALFAGGMAFDGEGALWVAMSDRVLKVAGAQGLTGLVTVAPDVVLTTPAPADLTSKLVVRPGILGPCCNALSGRQRCAALTRRDRATGVRAAPAGTSSRIRFAPRGTTSA